MECRFRSVAGDDDFVPPGRRGLPRFGLILRRFPGCHAPVAALSPWRGTPYVSDWQGTALEEIAPVPLPATALLLMGAVAGLTALRRRAA